MPKEDHSVAGEENFVAQEEDFVAQEDDFVAQKEDFVAAGKRGFQFLMVAKDSYAVFK